MEGWMDEYIAKTSQLAALLGLGSFVRIKKCLSTFRHIQDLGHFSRVHFTLQVNSNEAVFTFLYLY